TASCRRRRPTATVGWRRGRCGCWVSATARCAPWWYFLLFLLCLECACEGANGVTQQLPLSEVLSPPEPPKLDAKLFLTDDPALVVLYKQLREKTVQTLRGAVSISPRAEWEFVMHIA